MGRHAPWFLFISLILCGWDIMSVSAQAAKIVVPPKNVTVSTNEWAEFTSIIVGHVCVWRRNGGHIIDDLEGVIDIGIMSLSNMTAYQRCILRIMVTSTKNTTNITLTVISTQPELTMLNSSSVLLLVQGPLESVSELTVVSINSTTVLISWSPPFTQEGVPILDYNVTITNTTSGENETMSVEGGTTMLYYSIDHPDPDNNFSVTVVPINGAEVGEPATELFFFGSIINDTTALSNTPTSLLLIVLLLTIILLVSLWICYINWNKQGNKNVKVGIKTSAITIPKEITALQSVSGHTDVPTVRTLLNELKEVSEWFQLGVFMGVEVFVLEKIKQLNGGVEEYKIHLFVFWLKNAESPTWETMVRAVKELNPNLAKKLERDHLQKPQAKGGATDPVDTKISLINRLRALEHSFSHMIADVKKLLVDCDPTDARCFLSVLLVTDEFSDCDTMEKILVQLCQEYVDRFNVDYLRECLSRFKREDVNSLIEAYEQESDQFMETTTVLEFLQEVSSTAELAVRQGKASIDITVARKFAREITLKGVKTLAKNWFDDNHTSFINFNVIPRSIVITWFFPKRLTAKLQQLAVTNAAVFCQQGVYEVTVAGKICIQATQQ